MKKIKQIKHVADIYVVGNTAYFNMKVKGNRKAPAEAKNYYLMREDGTILEWPIWKRKSLSNSVPWISDIPTSIYAITPEMQMCWSCKS